MSLNFNIAYLTGGTIISKSSMTINIVNLAEIGLILVYEAVTIKKANIFVYANNPFVTSAPREERTNN